jgi:hypothetical protein
MTKHWNNNVLAATCPDGGDECIDGSFGRWKTALRIISKTRRGSDGYNRRESDA